MWLTVIVHEDVRDCVLPQYLCWAWLQQQKLQGCSQPLVNALVAHWVDVTQPVRKLASVLKAGVRAAGAGIRHILG